MKKYITIIATVFSSLNLFSQADFVKKFKQWSNQAYTEYTQGNYEQSALLNVKIYYLLEDNNVQERYDPAYNAACAYALAGNFDKAFEWLNLLRTDNKLDNYKYKSDKDFHDLKQDERWDQYADRKNEVKDKHNNVKMVKEELQRIYKTDQEIRFKLMNMSKELKEESTSRDLKDTYSKHIVKMKKIDSENLEKVESILSEYGWLGPDDVGFEASQALFLIIQHADLETQQEYLPIIREAAKKGKTLKSNLALIEDRVALRKGDKQIYGSQIWTDPETGEQFVDLLKEPLTVDSRRAAVGLPPMNDYLNQFFGIHWDPKEYQEKILPMLFKRQKKLAKSGGDS